MPATTRAYSGVPRRTAPTPAMWMLIGPLWTAATSPGRTAATAIMRRAGAWANWPSCQGACAAAALDWTTLERGYGPVPPAYLKEFQVVAPADMLAVVDYDPAIDDDN